MIQTDGQNEDHGEENGSEPVRVNLYDPRQRTVPAQTRHARRAGTVRTSNAQRY